MSTDQKVILTGKEALNKFLSGKSIWNAYVEENPIADVNFDRADFSSSGSMSFRGYCFPKGSISFHSAKFGTGDIDFSFVKFNGGDVCFVNTKFGDGKVSFSNTEFGNGKVNFQFAKFGKGAISFLRAKFGSGNVNFLKTQFGEGDVYFIDVDFGKGDIYFNNAKFSTGNIYFNNSLFHKGNLSFNKTEFGDGDKHFNNIEFREGLIDFHNAQLNKGRTNFAYSTFKGHLSLTNLINPEKISSLSMHSCTFDKSVDLSDNKFSCVPDLTNTKLANQTLIGRLECDPVKAKNGKADPLDTDRLCRLKELAESNKNHDQALYFHVQEMRARRDQLDNSISGRTLYTLDYLFDITSEYGRSISKPALSLIRIVVYYSIIYWIIGFTQNMEQGLIKNFGNALLYATSQLLPFTSSSRISATESAKQLFSSADIPNWFFALSLSQGLISFIFIFLLGLGLRNKFKI